MKGRREWTPAQTLIRDQILTVLRDRGELPVGDIGREVKIYGRKQSSGRITNDLLVLVTAGLVQVRREEVEPTGPWDRPKPGLKMWSLTEEAKSRLVSLDDLPPLDVHHGEESDA